MTALAWAFVACALLLVPVAGLAARDGTGSRPLGGAVGDDSPGGHAPTGRRRAASGVALAAGATAVACVVLLGLVPGLLVGAVVAAPVAAGVRYLQRRPVPVRPDRSVALALDLAAAALRAGRPLHQALLLAAPGAAGPVRDALVRVAGLIRLGADAEQAWGDLATGGPLAPVALAAIRSAASGIRLAAAFERLAAEIRADLTTAAAVRAERAGVLALAPLGACFLPSFVCLGIVPVVVGIARSAFGALR